MRLIDADALRADAITRSGGTEFAFDNCYPFWRFSQAIAQAPTIEAAPVVHGRWDDFCNGKMCCCSACKAEFDNACNEIHGEWKFCPHCGARMDKED